MWHCPCSLLWNNKHGVNKASYNVHQLLYTVCITLCVVLCFCLARGTTQKKLWWSFPPQTVDESLTSFTAESSLYLKFCLEMNNKTFFPLLTPPVFVSPVSHTGNPTMPCEGICSLLIKKWTERNFVLPCAAFSGSSYDVIIALNCYFCGNSKFTN